MTAAASSEFSSSHSAANVIDGLIHDFNADLTSSYPFRTASSAAGDQWLRIDLQQNHYVKTFYLSLISRQKMDEKTKQMAKLFSACVCRSARSGSFGIRP
jgi:hypothetical protein